MVENEMRRTYAPTGQDGFVIRKFPEFYIES